MCYNRSEPMSKLTDIRPSPLAGRWYPADPKTLADSVDDFINQAKIPEISGKIIALVSPHAGHMYSGQVAGHCFAAIRDLSPELVVILSPYHPYHSPVIFTTTHQAYETPLGIVPVDHDMLETVAKALLDKTGIKLSRVTNDGEHAVEILLPFFQRALAEEFRLLPLMIRQQDSDVMQALGDILAEILAERNVFLTASTDLSHNKSAEKARGLDQTIIDHIISLDPDGLYQAQRSFTGEACGLDALAALLWAAKSRGSVTAHHLHYAHSGDITGDNTGVVGYAAAVLTRE